MKDTLIYDVASDSYVNEAIDSTKFIVVTIINAFESEELLCLEYGDQIFSDGRDRLNPIFENTRYFGRNLDSLEECIRIVPEALEKSILIVHEALPNLNHNELEYYISIIKRNSSLIEDVLDGRPGFLFSIPPHLIEKIRKGGN